MKKNTTDRRRFLRTAAASGTAAMAGLSLPYLPFNSQLVRAADPQPKEGFKPKDHYFVFYEYPGGWDVLLSWDPRDPAVFTPAKMGETGIYPAYEKLLYTPKHGIYVDSALGKLGGFVGDLRLKKYTDKLAIIRGINMETLAHATGFYRFRTGRMPEGPVPTRDSTDVVMSTLLGKNNLVPNISLGVPSVNSERPAYANPLVAGNTDAISKAMARLNSMPESVEAAVRELMEQHEGCDHSVQSEYLTKAHEAQSTVDDMLKAKLAEKMDFKANTEQAKAMRSHYGFSTGQLSSVEALTALAEVALTQQITRCVSIRVPGVNGGNSFDTHRTLEQGQAQMRTNNSIARLIDRLEAVEYPDGSGDSWLDRTTIICTSEFTRSPLLEYGSGRGHWLSNVCVMAGGGIKTNQVIGATSDVGMAPRPIDFKTGKVVPNSPDILTPDRIVRTLYTMLGYENDVADLRIDPLPVLLKNG